MKLIEFRNVSKRFGRQVVLDRINLQVNEGESLVIIGASGSGKSVMLKHMVGLLCPDSGEVYFDGHRIDKLSERELEVVRLVAEGLSNKEISARLSLSDKTVKNHISHILAKMNLTARTQVAVYAIRAGLV